MRRRKNQRLTFIYWLFDTQTGVPFYCGKTVMEPARRLLAHKYDAKNGTTRVNIKVIGFHRKGAMTSEETRAKQRAAKLGKKRTPEEIEKIRIASTGRKMSAEGIAKSAAARTGKKRTPEQRARMSAAHKGKKWTQAQRDARLA